MILGITYGAVRTHGFKAELVTFEIPEDNVINEVDLNTALKKSGASVEQRFRLKEALYALRVISP